MAVTESSYASSGLKKLPLYQVSGPQFTEECPDQKSPGLRRCGKIRAGRTRKPGRRLCGVHRDAVRESFLRVRILDTITKVSTGLWASEEAKRKEIELANQRHRRTHLSPFHFLLHLNFLPSRRIYWGDVLLHICLFLNSKQLSRCCSSLLRLLPPGNRGALRLRRITN